jgi:hypothetical protein
LDRLGAQLVEERRLVLGRLVSPFGELARASDVSFQPRPWHESLQLGSNSDVSFGDIWTTAAWAIVLAADGQSDGLPGLPACTGRLARKPKAK